MERSELVIAGDTPGLEWRLPVLRFAGKDATAPKTYIQAALHAGELPGVAALHFAIPLLQQAEARGEILGDITVVPKANPIGASQYVNGHLQGRFDQASRTNFNRDFPLVAHQQLQALADDAAPCLATVRLKRHLLTMAAAADLVLDLHCDDQSVIYAYLHEKFWPEATDLAESFGLAAVLLSDGESSAFEDAVSHAWRAGDLGGRSEWHQGRLSLTMEFRGLADVDPDTARKDAAAILSFLRRRGAIAGAPDAHAPFEGPVAGLDYVQMVDSPVFGAVLFERNVGETVRAGDRLATIVPEPGNPDRDVVVTAPCDGYIVTRVVQRIVRPTDNLMKIASLQPSGARRKPGGGLED